MIAGLKREPLSAASYFAVEFDPDTRQVVMLDQRLLPGEVTYHRYDTSDEVSQAITNMVVRGAPAIGVSAAYALVLLAAQQKGGRGEFFGGQRDRIQVSQSGAADGGQPCLGGLAHVP